MLLALSACSLRPDPEQMVRSIAAKEFQSVKTTSSRLDFLQAIINYRSIIHNDFYTFSYYPDKVGKLNPYQGRDLKLLWHSQLQQFDVTIQFDESLKPCEEQLKQVLLAQYFPAEYLMSGSQRLPLSIVLTGQSSLATLNFIDPENPELRFVFRYSCENSDPAGFFQEMTGKVYHETVHYFQHLDSRQYDRYYPARKNTARHRAMLWETMASIQEYCAVIHAPIFTSFHIDKPKDDRRIVLTDTQDSAAQHSIAGELFAIFWFIRFIDNEGFIRKTNTAQYEQVRAACSADSSEVIKQAAAIVAERVIAKAPGD
jgi:hypothetical protein